MGVIGILRANGEFIECNYGNHGVIAKAIPNEESETAIYFNSSEDLQQSILYLNNTITIEQLMWFEKNIDKLDKIQLETWKSYEPEEIISLDKSNSVAINNNQNINICYILNKIKVSKDLFLFNILTQFLIMIPIVLLRINLLYFGGLIYLITLSTVAFFYCNDTYEKYSNLEGSFNMSKEKFTSFFKNGAILKYILTAILPITLIFWWYNTLYFDVFFLSLTIIKLIITIILFSVFVFVIFTTINSFITTIFLVRVIRHCVKNNLLNNKVDLG